MRLQFLILALSGISSLPALADSYPWHTLKKLQCVVQSGEESKIFIVGAEFRQNGLKGLAVAGREPFDGHAWTVTSVSSGNDGFRVSAVLNSSTLNLFISEPKLDKDVFTGEIKGTLDGQEYSYTSICEVEFIEVNNLPKHLESLKSPDVAIRREAASAIEKMAYDVDPASALDPLISALNDSDATVKVAVIHALGKFGHPAVRAFLPLVARLKEDDGHYGSDGNNVAWAAKMALINLGRPTDDMAPALVHSLKDPHLNIRVAAATALGKMAPFTSFAISNLVEGLGDEQVDVRAAMVEALGKFGPAAADAVVPILEASLKKGGSGNIVEALAHIGPTRVSAVPELINVINEANKSSDYVAATKEEAAKSLGRIGEGASGAVPVLVSLLQDGKYEVRREATYALEKIGITKAVPLFISALGDVNFKHKDEIAFLLGRIVPKPIQAIPVLKAALGNPNYQVRMRAVQALGMIGNSADLFPLLLQVFEHDENMEVRAYAVDALKQLGSLPVEVIPALINGLKIRSWTIQSTCAELLGQFGSTAKEAVPELIAIVKEPANSRLVRGPAIEALGRMGPAAVSAIPALKEALSDPEESVRDAAQNALELIQK